MCRKQLRNVQRFGFQDCSVEIVSWSVADANPFSHPFASASDGSGSLIHSLSKEGGFGNGVGMIQSSMVAPLSSVRKGMLLFAHIAGAEANELTDTAATDLRFLPNKQKVS